MTDGPFVLWLAPTAPARETLETIVDLDAAGVDAVVLRGGVDPLLAAGAASRRAPRIGLVAALSPWCQPPFLMARALNTLDALTSGRAGWWIDPELPATLSVDDSGRWTAATAGEAELRPALRDYLDATTALWGSWEPGAIVADVPSGRYVDASRVHVTDHRGDFYRTRGPLNSPRGPQGAPVRFARFQSDAPIPADVSVVSREDQVERARDHSPRVLLELDADRIAAAPDTAADGYAIAGPARGAEYGAIVHGALRRLAGAPRRGTLRDRLGLVEPEPLNATRGEAES